MDLPLKSLGRLAWPRSGITPSPKGVAESRITMKQVLSSIKGKFEPIVIPRAVPLDTRPRLPNPKIPGAGSFQPPRYFSKGALEENKKKNPTPIWALLTESLESPISRAIPQNVALIRSLCKGKGRLVRGPKGLFYLDVQNSFITAMIPYLKTQGLIRPPYFNIFNTPDGAHIPVVSKREADFHYLESMREQGQEYPFEVEGLYSVMPDTWPEVDEVWFLKATSSELQILRRKYFLSALPNGHSFHIVIAIKPRSRVRTSARPAPFMRINSTYIFAA
jgi:hypothetical protein